MPQTSHSLFVTKAEPSETSSGLLEEVIGKKREAFISGNFLFNSL